MATIWVAVTEREDDIPPQPIRSGSKKACKAFLVKRAQDEHGVTVEDVRWLSPNRSSSVLADTRDAFTSYGYVTRLKVIT